MPLIERPYGRVLHYQVTGKGDDVFVLPGMGFCAAYALPTIQLLASNCKVISYDHQGLGKSKGAPPPFYSIKQMADELMAVADHLRIDSFHMVGESMAGMIGIQTALMAPKRIRSLTLVNTSIRGPSAPWQRLTPFALGKMLRGLTSQNQLAEAMPLALFSKSTIDERPEVARQWNNTFHSTGGIPAKTVIRQLLAAARFNPLSQLNCLQLPVLIVYGEDDPMVMPSCSQRLSKLIKKAKLVGLDATGHNIMMENPEGLAQVIRDWYRDLAMKK